MSDKPITKKQVLDFLHSIPEEEVWDIIKMYDSQHKTKLNEKLDLQYSNEMEMRLLKAGVNATCPNPKCQSSERIRRGRTKFQRYRCKVCNTSYSAVSNTFMEHTDFTWKQWVKIVEMTINGYSLAEMVNVFEKDFDCQGMQEATMHLARHKILNTMYQIPQPVLTGVIQIDETHFRESQKAARKLINYHPSIGPRVKRKGKQSSVLGVMGSEFTTVPTAIDSSGHIVAKVACLGRLKIELFTDLFHDHIENPAYICTDANPIYKRYCALFGIPHYIRPSNYLDIISKAGYKQALFPDEEMNIKTRAENNKILENLYSQRAIDSIRNKGHITFKDFQHLKRTYGLNLGAVNKQHSEIKRVINTNKAGVCSKYLDRYINLYVFLHNWSIDYNNGVYPSSNKDAEEILIHILQAVPNSKFTLKDLKKIKFNLPKPTKKYMELLASMTSIARKEFNNKYLKFNEEDSVYDFKRREYLFNCPRKWLNDIAREKGLPYGKSITMDRMVSNLLKLKDLDIIGSFSLSTSFFK